MSIITPARGDLLSLHNPFHGQLQPSTMAAQMPSNLSASFPSASFDKSRLDDLHNENTYDSVSTWRKNIDLSAPSAPSREALTDLSVNSSRIASRQASRATTSTSIPRPSLTPDVFAPTEDDHLPMRPNVSTSKRTRDAVPLATSKRAKVDKVAKTEEAAWRSKWVKSFPTLIFHFELGTEGHGKILENRVKAMGAVSLISRLTTDCRGLTNSSRPELPISLPRALDRPRRRWLRPLAKLFVNRPRTLF